MTTGRRLAAAAAAAGVSIANRYTNEACLATECAVCRVASLAAARKHET